MSESSGAPGDALRRRVPRSVLRVLSLAWVPLAAATLSLALSVVSIVLATREPAVMLIMPSVVRIAQGEDFGSAYLYLQPAFVSTGENDRVEVIRDMTLLVEPTDGGDAAEFVWDEQVQLITDPATGDLSYEYVADAVPLLVSPRTAQAPFGLFDAPSGWYFEPGTYRFTLRASRVVASSTLAGDFEVTFTPAQIDELNASRGQRFLTFPLDEG